LRLTALRPWGGCTGEEHYPPTDRIHPEKPEKPDAPKCDEMPNFNACMACCSTISGQLGPTGRPGGACAESCYRKAGITQGPVNQCGG